MAEPRGQSARPQRGGHRRTKHPQHGSGRPDAVRCWQEGQGAQARPGGCTLGLLLPVTITAAGVQDRDAAVDVGAPACAKVPGLKRLYADAAYGGKCVQAIEATHAPSVEVVSHPGDRSTGTWQDAQQTLSREVVAKGFVVQAKRWVAERTHAWNEHSRRLMAHHDRSTWAPLAWVWLAEGRVFATRLAAKLISSAPSQAVPRPFVEFARHLRWLCLSAPMQS